VKWQQTGEAFCFSWGLPWLQADLRDSCLTAARGTPEARLWLVKQIIILKASNQGVSEDTRHETKDMSHWILQWSELLHFLMADTVSRLFFIYTWVRASWVKFNNCLTRCDLFSLLYFCGQLYMFRVLAPVIRSAYNSNYSFWYCSTGSATIRSRCWVGTDSCLSSNSTTRADMVGIVPKMFWSSPMLNWKKKKSFSSGSR